MANIAVYDYNTLMKDKYIGSCKFVPRDTENGSVMDIEHDSKKIKARGKIEIELVEIVD